MCTVMGLPFGCRLRGIITSFGQYVFITLADVFNVAIEEHTLNYYSCTLNLRRAHCA